MIIWNILDKALIKWPSSFGKILLSVTCLYTSEVLSHTHCYICWLDIDTVHVHMHIYVLLWEGTRRYHRVLAGNASASHWKDILVQWRISLCPSLLSFCLLVCDTPQWRASCDSVIAFYEADSALLLYAILLFLPQTFVTVFRSSICLCENVTSAVWWPVFSLAVFVCVFFAREQGCVDRWVCLTHMYPASIFQLFLWAAGLSSTLQAEMAFDNGLNRQMPGRHLAIDHSSECCFHFPCNPPA